MRYARLVLVLLAFSFPSACADPKPPAPSADEVRTAIETQNRAFGEAVHARDQAAIAQLYTEDGAALPPNAPAAKGRAALGEFWGKVLESGITGAVLTTEEVAYSGGDTATEIGSAALSVTDGSVADEGKYIVLWKQTPAGWRMHRDIWNSNRAPAAAAPVEAAEPSAGGEGAQPEAAAAQLAP